MIERRLESAAGLMIEAKTALLAEKELLEKQLAHLGIRDGAHWDTTGVDVTQNQGEEPSQEPDPLDTAAHIEELEERSANSSNAQILLNQVNEALASLEKGSYGTCTSGGSSHPIEEGRLRATEWKATTCIAHRGESL